MERSFYLLANGLYAAEILKCSNAIEKAEFPYKGVRKLGCVGGERKLCK